MKVAFHTLGCKVNHYETEAIKEAFVSRGAEVAGEEEFADVYIINTCTVTNIADRKSRQFIRRAKRVNPDAIVTVTGCYAQVAADEVASMPEVDLIVGNGRKSEICGLVIKKLEEKSRAEASGDRAAEPGGQMAGLAAEESCPAGCGDVKPCRCGGTKEDTDVLVLPRAELTYYEDMGKVTSAGEGMIRAYLKIQDGCDRFCSYCLIPFARGPVRSRPKDEILEELRGMLDNGFREIVLTGINTALYGTEEGADCSLSGLLTAIDEMECPDGDDFRIRLSSLEPTVVDKDNVEEIIRHRRLCHHLHLSAQSGSSNVLRSMNRHYSREEYLEIVAAIRDYDPLFGITTDIIAGFPGESQEDFNDSLDIVRKAEFGRTHVFRYSPRRGTAGAAMKDAVPEKVKKERAAALEALGDETAGEFIRSNSFENSGVTHTVLIEEMMDGYATGYTGNYIKVYISDPERELKAGEFVKAAIKEPFRDGAYAELYE